MSSRNPKIEGRETRRGNCRVGDENGGNNFGDRSGKN